MGERSARREPLRLLGTSRGTVSRLAPRTRILAGALVFAACLACDARTGAGLATIAVGVLGWLAAAGAPPGLVGRLTLLGTLMLGPVLVLTPLVDAGAGQASRLAVTFAIFAKGLSTMLVATVTASTLTLAGIHQGLATLPLPRLLIAVVVQVFMQAGMLARETARMARAIAVRRAAVGVRHAVTTLAGVSSGWTHRLLFKVERVAAAMELRGFDGTDPPGGVPAGRARDAVALALAAAWTAGVIAVRLGGAR